jgi:hypothetical protein
MIARTAPAAAPAMTLTAVFLRVFVVPLVFLEPPFLRPVRAVLLAPLLDLDDDVLRRVLVGILILLLMVAASCTRLVHNPAESKSSSGPPIRTRNA